MQVWAITGGVACGKSTVCRLFQELGATIYSADTDAQEVRAIPEVQEEILVAFGTIEKGELAKIIYGDDAKRKKLGSLLHPRIREKMQVRIQQARQDTSQGLLLYEVPLLFEGGLETWFDGVIAVIASLETQKLRLQLREVERGRPKLSEQELEKRLASQLLVAEKARRAQYVIRTDVALASFASFASLERTREQVEYIHKEITKK